MKFRSSSRNKRHAEGGYVLLTLVLFVALLAIAATLTAPVLLFQLKRDREEEMVHRGTQYTRAIKHYYKKFGNYPATIEQLENTNQVRFLRRRYKDPISGKDFKILRMGDVQISFNNGINGAQSVAALAQANQGAAGAGGFNNGFGNNGFNSNGPNGPASGFANSGIGNQGGLGQQQILNAVGQQPSAGNNQQVSQNPDLQNSGEDNGDQNAPAGVANTAAGAAANGGSGAPGTASNSGSTFGSSNNQPIGGLPVMGVASTSKDKTIRIYNKKDRYYQWQFVYDPSLDMGGLITTPYQQSMQAVSNLQPGQNTQNGQQQNNGPAGLPNTLNAPNQFGSPQGNQNQNQPQTPQMPPDQNEQ